MEVVIRVISGPHKGQEFAFDREDTYLVGRSPNVRFSVHDDRHLSREHFEIEFKPPLCVLKDLGSTNGTKVNGLRVETSQLRDGDVIAAGDSSFMVQVSETMVLGSPRLRCLGCGQTAPAEVIGDAPTLSDEIPATHPGIWLCTACEAQRRRFPTTHPDYLIERRIGAGGMGEVYLARQLSINRQVAIKTMTTTHNASTKAKDYFRREMTVLRDLLIPGGRCHPNIVAFYDIFEVGDHFQLIMEHVPGRNALELIAEMSIPLPVTTAARIGMYLLSALDYAHGKGYVHRDVKPSNLLVMGPPQRLQVKLSDFGLAKSFRQDEGEDSAVLSLTHHGEIAGSNGFLSPDHIRDFRDVREAADIYSAGATLYYLLTRQYPYYGFDPNKPESYHIVLEHPSVPLRAHRPDVPEGLERILRKALEKQPRDRWKSAAAMIEAIRPYYEGGTPT